jgi:hypothetical protein
MRRGAMACALAALCGSSVAASEQTGRVTFNDLPVPGATITAQRGERQIVRITDRDGAYRFADLADGVWMLRVEMLGFAASARDVAVAPNAPALTWTLTLLPVDRIVPLQTDGPRRAAEPAALSAHLTTDDLNAPALQPADIRAPAAFAHSEAIDQPLDAAADSLLVNGSVNNGAASPFAQLAAFGNDRRRARSLYNWGFGVLLGNSALDARPYSFTGQPNTKPSYNNLQLLGAFGGPISLPHVIDKRPNVFVGYQHVADHSATTQAGLVPTSLERGGDFSQTVDASGRPIQITDPLTGRPFPGNVIPANRISTQAAALLALYPQPAGAAEDRYNFEAPVPVTTDQHTVQSRMTEVLDSRTQIFGNVGYQRTATQTTTMFGFQDGRTASTLTAAGNWSHRLSPSFALVLRYQFDDLTNEATPYFAFRTNVSGDAGIAGNQQDPVNWGPPALAFASGIATLADIQAARSTAITNAGTVEGLWTEGHHNLTIGGGVHRRHTDALMQQDPRGTFSFTGALTGSDLADFLLGVPHASAIAFGNADKYLRGNVYETYASDDWRLSGSLTINAGVRWEYEAPMTEAYGRLVNLDIAPSFTAVSPVLATDPVGALTGNRFPDSLLRPDRSGVEPRVGMAWRPVSGSSLVVRAGYGVYRNASVYQSIDLLLAQQPPLSKTFSISNSAANPLTLANGFVAPPDRTTNTLAVDPDFRVGEAQTWQVTMQRDLPRSLALTLTYSGVRGFHLMQESLPNTYPIGAVNPCPTCPAGFVYLTSNGTSSREAVQVELRRRLRDGLMATIQYALSTASDDAGAASGVNLTGSAIAQDWRQPDAERGPSNFDQRHLLNVQVQYTTGVGFVGGGLLTGAKGALVKGWTFASQLTAGSGLPLTPVYLLPVPGTGVTGSIRASVTADAATIPDGAYASAAAYTAPAPGAWGTAGRNSIRGPAQFGLNASVTRTFALGQRLYLDARVDATNVLNTVTYSAVNTIVGSPQFGLPTQANTMRRLLFTIRLRY